MSNAVLESLLKQRGDQTQFIDELLTQVADAGRDLVDAERANLESAKQRIAKLDEQIKPIEEFEAVRAAHQSSTAAVNRPAATHSRAQGAGLSVKPREQKYDSAGHYLVDYIRAIGNPSRNVEPDVDAMQRVSAALGRAVNDVAPGNHVTTADHPGLLPEPIIGEVLTDLDGTRPFITSVGIRPLNSIPGKVFHRPYVSLNTSVQEQLAEKGELVVGDHKVEALPFTKRTFGGALNISRQDIDFTSPEAWNIVINDLEFIYAEETEDIAAADFAGSVTQTQAVEDPDSLEGWIEALYLAAVVAATAGGTKRARARRLPNAIWTSIDMWATIGALIDAVRVQNSNTGQVPGSGTVTGFAGSLLDVPRIMVPGFETGTVIVGRTNLYEYYEQRIGLLQAIQPRVLGVEVAYGGYGAFGNLQPDAFCKLAPAVEGATVPVDPEAGEGEGGGE